MEYDNCFVSRFSEKDLVDWGRWWGKSCVPPIFLKSAVMSILFSLGRDEVPIHVRRNQKVHQNSPIRPTWLINQLSV